jgi:hypothetical protein
MTDEDRVSINVDLDTRTIARVVVFPDHTLERQLRRAALQVGDRITIHRLANTTDRGYWLFQLIVDRAASEDDR